MRTELIGEIYSRISQKVRDFFDLSLERMPRRDEEGTVTDRPIFLGDSSSVSGLGSSIYEVGSFPARHSVKETTITLFDNSRLTPVKVKGVLLFLTSAVLTSTNDLDCEIEPLVKDFSRTDRKVDSPGNLGGVITLSIRLSLTETVSLSRKDEVLAVSDSPRITPV